MAKPYYKTEDVMVILSDNLRSYESRHTELEELSEYIYDLCREDAFYHEALLKTVEDRNEIHELLHTTLLKAHNQILADRLAALACGFITHDTKYRDHAIVGKFVLDLVDRKTKCSNSGVLTAIGFLLKVPKLRPHLWNISDVHVLIRASLSITKSDTVSQYQAVFCTWLLSFNPRFLPHIYESGIFIKLLTLLKSTPRKEKIVRLGLEIIVNSLNDKDTLECMIEEKLGETLDSFLFENWRSEELYDRINSVSEQYIRHVRDWSTFERYQKELDTGKLKPGYLHQADFWAENVMKFEEKEFRVVRKLITLLRSTEPSTLSLACHDIGEFAHLHPTGKQVLKRLHARDMLLALVNHKDRTVERESLLALQKLMLDNIHVQ